MINQEKLKKIVNPLLMWYQKNKRELPWRKENNAYHIWISEIMLQQTRIEAVKGYYDCFLKELPTIHDLAEVEEEKLLKLWEGLGYYNRARNLKKAAQLIERNNQGQMPKNYEELVKLPGIGEYTAGAIASIAFQEKVPAVDGNVLRVISRVLGSKKDVLEPSTKKEVSALLKEIMPKKAGDFNEGMMELGEMICLPKGDPLCNQCPLKDICTAKKENLTQEIPVRENKIKRKKEEKTVLILRTKEGKVAIVKREEKGLLAGMYEFPNVNENLKVEEVKKIVKEKWKLEMKDIKKMKNHKHIFSHIEWKMIGYQVNVEAENTQFLWVKKESLFEKYAIPGAFASFRKEID